MITSVFGKSSPINSILITFLLIVGFFINQFQQLTKSLLFTDVLLEILVLFFLILSLHISDFIVKKNNILKDNSFVILFATVFIFFFPIIFETSEIILSNFFILLAIRRLISLQSLISPKEKIFDASLWIFIASLFYFWSILFLFLVFISIFLHVANDYRNWFLPFIAFFAMIIFVYFIDITTNLQVITYIFENAKVSFTFNYFENKMQSFAVGLFFLLLILFLIPYLLFYSKRTSQVQNSIKKVVIACIISMGIYIISPNKSNAVLLFSIFPMSVFVSTYIEYAKKDWFKEVVGLILILCGILIFVFG